MKIFDKWLLRVLDDLAASPDWASTWWADAVALPLQQSASELQDEKADLAEGTASPRAP